MLSRTADHLYWMARYMERAGRGPQGLRAQPQHSLRVSAEAVFSARGG